MINQPPTPVAVPQGHFSFAPLEVSFHHVTVNIKDQVAVTSVDQEFVNPNSRQLEGTYLFPLPRDGAVDKFSMDINGKMQEAELLPADKARSIYEDIVRRHRDPALLEYVGRDTFKVRIFPIEANGKKRVKIQYTQAVQGGHGADGVHVPAEHGEVLGAAAADVSVKVNLETREPLKSVYCPTHNVEIKRDGGSKAVVGVRGEERPARHGFQAGLLAGGEEGPGYQLDDLPELAGRRVFPAAGVAGDGGEGGEGAAEGHLPRARHVGVDGGEEDGSGEELAGLSPSRGHIQFDGVVFGYQPGRPVIARGEPGIPAWPDGRLGRTYRSRQEHTDVLGSALLRPVRRARFDRWTGYPKGQDREPAIPYCGGPAGPFLMPLTIAENIAYGRPTASREEITRAAIAANADEFIRKLPQGYDSVIGERGAKLSGGQKQRLAIARAFLKDAPILILDEPTSALDGENEALIVDALDRLRKGRTTIIIAHKPATIRKADLVMAMSGGRLIEGGQTELMASGFER